MSPPPPASLWLPHLQAQPRGLPRPPLPSEQSSSPGRDPTQPGACFSSPLPNPPAAAAGPGARSSLLQSQPLVQAPLCVVEAQDTDTHAHSLVSRPACPTDGRRGASACRGSQRRLHLKDSPLATAAPSPNPARSLPEASASSLQPAGPQPSTGPRALGTALSPPEGPGV